MCGWIRILDDQKEFYFKKEVFPTVHNKIRMEFDFEWWFLYHKKMEYSWFYVLLTHEDTSSNRVLLFFEDSKPI